MSLKVELLERSFKQIGDRGLEFTAEFYANLFANYPEVQPLFQNTQLEAQGKKLFDSLVLVVDNLRQPEVLSQALKGLGTKHVNYGVLPEHYPMVGNSLLMTFASFLDSDWTPEVKAAWTEAYGAVTQLMWAGTDYPPEILNCDR
ncbi:MAG: hypothetical protein KME17_30820 [Cyanosarcina radialis HA8281-LM2]|jgi:hemoglobin-like flavoprotein|nr:hypothetical protein [Cyanosarcina radialis HA8281-LM2]